MGDSFLLRYKKYAMRTRDALARAAYQRSINLQFPIPGHRYTTRVYQASERAIINGLVKDHLAENNEYTK